MSPHLSFASGSDARGAVCSLAKFQGDRARTPARRNFRSADMTMTKTRIQVAFQAYSEVGQILEVLDPKGDKPPPPRSDLVGGLGPDVSTVDACCPASGLAALCQDRAVRSGTWHV